MAAAPQAEEALIKAARDGDLAALTRLVEEKVNIEAADRVSAAPPRRHHPLPPHRPSALAARRPCCPALAARRSPRVAPPPRLRSTAGRPS